MEPNLENKCVRDDSQTSTLSKKMQKKIQNGAKKSGKWQQTQIWWGSLRSTPSGQQVGAGGGGPKPCHQPCRKHTQIVILISLRGKRNRIQMFVCVHGTFKRPPGKRCGVKRCWLATPTPRVGCQAGHTWYPKDQIQSG